ncbi:MAG: hypothetical protein GY953_01080, partial [bacterium]|nr:hypothetical protein [bacterium]
MSGVKLEQILDSGDESIYELQTKGPGPEGKLPVTPEMLIHQPSGDLFGWGVNA